MHSKIRELLTLRDEECKIQSQMAILKQDILLDTSLLLTAHIITEGHLDKCNYSIDLYITNTTICVREYGTNKDPEEFLRNLKSEKLFKDRIIDIIRY